MRIIIENRDGSIKILDFNFLSKKFFLYQTTCLGLVFRLSKLILALTNKTTDKNVSPFDLINF